MFILVDSKVSSCSVNVDVGACEAVFCKLMLPNSKVLTACSLCRPPGSSVSALSQLTAVLETIQTDTLVIGGDFNLPSLDCCQQPNIVTTTDSCSQEMKNLLDYFALEQTVLEPTRGGNILDLVLTNQPELVTSSAVVDGISDHNAVVCEMHISYVTTITGPSRRIFNFEKADVAQINESLDSYLTVLDTGRN